MRKLTVITEWDQNGYYCYHIEVAQSDVDAGADAIASHIAMDEYEWIIAIFDGHINCIVNDPAKLPSLEINTILHA